MDEIQYVLGSDFDEDEWMDVTQCIVMDPLCFADMEKVFMERLAEKESSNATGPAHPSDEATQQWKDREGKVGTSGKKVEVATRDDDRDGMPSTSVGSLLKDLSAWRLMMDWAQDKIGYPDLDNKLRGFGSRYIHEEWRPLISAIFMQSDPSNEELQPPSSLVKEAMRAYGVSFVTHTDLVPTVPASQPNPPWSTMGISQFLDLAAEEDDSEDDYADEDIDETQGSAGCPTEAGPTGKSSFSRAIDGLMARYSGPSRPHNMQKQKLPQIPEGIPLPMMKNIYIVDLFLGAFTSREQLNRSFHSLIQQDIILLPPMEATLLSVFKARQTLPVRTWVCIKKGPYKGDIGFVERSYPTNVVLIVAPREHPYDLPEQRGEKSLFSKMVLLFSAQFWCKFDTVEIWSGELRGSRGRLIDIEWYKRTASLFLPTDERLEGDVNARGETIHCAIQELCRVFNTGQAVRIIAGPYRGYTGHVIMAYDGTLEVSDLLLEAHMPDHVHSLATGHTDTHMRLPEPADAVLPGDTVNISQGAYKGAEAPIEWMSVNGTQAWIYVKETKYSSTQTGVHSTQGQDPNQQVQYSSAQTDVNDTLGMHPDRLVGYIMVPMNVHDVRVHRAARTLAFSKEKGFDICVGDDVEVARGKWFRSRGTVQTVHFDNAYLDFVCDTYGQKISVPITFCRKVAERSGPQLSQWIGRDVWVIHGEKKGYQGTLRTLGRDISCVTLQGQLIHLRNDYIATPTGLVLNGTRLPLGAVQELQRRSFIPDIRSVTPPPSAPPPSAIPEDPSATTSEAWTTTADDLSSTDFGELPWLFQANCCNFQHYQLGFTMNDQYRPYNNASLMILVLLHLAMWAREFSITLFL
ncbi:hypothetical protein EDC04DRAFT_2617701 [Pisolithus marmoratus]|nr:hypothetical protein EDC04DRAFT_2617701 [Pisolithus marmoratus]